MKCYDCKAQINDAIGYEAYILCYPCYDLWSKADIQAQAVIGTGIEL